MNRNDPLPIPHRDRVEREANATVACAVVTISDTRTLEDDESGDMIAALLAAEGHAVVLRQIVRDESHDIQQLISMSIAAKAAVLITNGGTGIAKRDATFEAVDGLLERHLPGFGELFRSLSFPVIGPAAMLTRATAGTIGDLLLFCLPGSPHAVQLAMEQLILPDLPHLAWETVRR